MPQTLPNPPAHVQADQPISAPTAIVDAPGALRFSRLTSLLHLTSLWRLASLWHLTSLDAPTVAVVWSLAFAWAAGLRLPPWIPLLLALAAWAVYIADRLLDARSALRTANLTTLRERHRFHHRHRRVLFPLAVAAAIAAFWIVFTQMPIAARERNSALAVAALAYFTRVHSPFRLPSLGLARLLKKELLVGLLFTAACALPAISRVPNPGPLAAWPLYAAASFFALLAWLNCHAIEVWESPAWESAISPRTPKIQTQAGLLALSGIALAFLLGSAHPHPAALVLCGVASTFLLALLDRQRHRLTPLALRTAADLVLLTPLALLLA